MNKYTLKFCDPLLEASYSMDQMFKSRMIILLLFSGLTIFITAFHVFAALASQNAPMTIEIIILAYSLISLPLLYFKVIGPQTGLILQNNFMMLLQFTVQDQTLSFNAFMKGSNLMMGHCGMIFACDFPQAVFQILILCIFRILVSANLQMIGMDMLISTIIQSVIYIAGTYRITFTTRNQYLLYIKDSQWDKILPKLIDKPFIYFDFYERLLTFRLKLSNIYTEDGAFHSFLRQAFVKKTSLENHFFRSMSIKRSTVFDSITTRNIKIVQGKKQQTIQCLEFYLEAPCFFLLFNDSEQQIEKSRQLCINIQKKNKNILTKFMQLNFKYLNQGLKQKNKSILYKLRFIQFQVLLKQAKPKLQIINLFQQLILLQSLIKDRKIQINYPNNDKTLQIKTIRPYLLQMIIHILSFFRSPTIQISYELNILKETIIIMTGKIILNQEKIKVEQFQQLIKSFKIYSGENGDSLIVVLNPEPYQSYL